MDVGKVCTSQAMKAKICGICQALIQKKGFADYIISCLQLHGLILLANSLKCDLSLPVSNTDIANQLILDIQMQRRSLKSVDKYFKALSTP